MPHTIYPNEVLENKFESQLTTALDMSRFATIDNTLSQNAGMTKVIHVYNWAGSAEDLAKGQGNTGDIDVGFNTVNYTVGVTQARSKYFDEDAMSDPMLVDTIVKGMSEAMQNDLTAKIVAELNKTTTTSTATNWDFDDFVDAIGKYPYESEDGLFVIANTALKTPIRKALNDDLKYVDSYATKAYIGTVAGVPVYLSDAVPSGTAFLATKDAVTIFVKKGSEVEQERDADTRENRLFARKVALVALTDATRCIKMG